jgi:hypothetical protein
VAKSKTKTLGKSSIFDPKTKERLFADFFSAARGTLESFEQHYNVIGVLEQVFGKDTDESQAQDHFRKSTAWHYLTKLYEYAVNGVDDGDNSSLVIDGSDVLLLATSEEYRPSDEWFQIVAMGDGRYALDDGMNVEIEKLALLAQVDVRTVRNAISAGELLSEKLKVDDEKDMIFVDNMSAKRWLRNRKGFKQSVCSYLKPRTNLESVETPAGFGAFLATQRKELELDGSGGKLVVFHPSVNAEALADLEAGVFSLPLDAVFPLADFYQLSRRELLNCVMRVFFSEELSVLSEDAAKKEPQS